MSVASVDRAAEMVRAAGGQVVAGPLELGAGGFVQGDGGAATGDPGDVEEGERAADGEHGGVEGPWGFGGFVDRLRGAD